MAAGFYMMFAVSIILYRVAIADRKKGWIWFGVNLCVSMLMAKLFGSSIPIAILAGVVTYIGMFIVNIVSPMRFK
ncbi:hypothetical protein M5M_14890 [Simiduia agarivorans SA1 = DSM 21679]|uniref:Uncharacterized protein n=1 Tax=Simiduia agarivorans (strain DSM 21679 / JCM 13881 / BCRC 17597 / SA1) TaxID=1117647 RepID=K4L1R4_SIMAS|nr:hypothetical protein M5M_14890 [Simiduia agarivorans SA1 = DSM 21679]